MGAVPAPSPRDRELVPGDGPTAAVVIGGGTMGAGIAQVLLGVVDRVRLVEKDDGSLRAAEDRVRVGLERGHRHEADPQGAVQRSLARLDLSAGIGGDGAVDLVVEAVHEDVGLKVDVLARASRVWPGALIASNTSSLSVTELARSVSPGSAFVGMHFFNPVPRSKLVEIVRPDGCDDATVEAAQRWVALMGKESIEVRDSPGFATSRLGVAIALEAMRMVESGVASVGDIDRGMVLGYQYPIGPLRLTDMIGLDVRLAIAEHLAATLGPRFEPPNVLRQKVAAGELGQKSGRGFYEWDQ